MCGTVPGYTLGCGPGGAAFAVPYGAFTNVSNINDIGRAHYDSLQVKAETKSARHGLYALIGYTYSRTFDTGFPDGLGTHPGRDLLPAAGTQKADWGLSQINLNHSFTASVIYELPFGKGKPFGSVMERPSERRAGQLGSERDRKGHLRIPGLRRGERQRQLQRLRSELPEQRQQPEPSRVGDPNQAGGAATRDAPRSPGAYAGRLVQHVLLSWTRPRESLGTPRARPVYGPGFVNTDFSPSRTSRCRSAKA